MSSPTSQSKQRQAGLASRTSDSDAKFVPQGSGETVLSGLCPVALEAEVTSLKHTVWLENHSQPEGQKRHHGWSAKGASEGEECLGRIEE